MKLKAFLGSVLLSLISTFTYADLKPTISESDVAKFKIFLDRLDAYRTKHEDNLRILNTYSVKENKTESENALYEFTVCSTVTNLKRSLKHIEDNPEYAQYLNGTMIPSIQENLDFHVYVATLYNGTDADCRKFN